jgi:hypothetical protein
MPIVDRLMLLVQRAIDPFSLILPQVFASRPILVFGALVASFK